MDLKRLGVAEPAVVRDVWASGFVNRWHTHPDPRLRDARDTTAAHQHRVATLVAFIAPQIRLDEILTALWHDAAEVWAGDIPWTAKHSDALLRDDEKAWWVHRGMAAPLPSVVVALCDALDAYLFVKWHAPDLLNHDEWQKHCDVMLQKAAALGVHGRVKDLIAQQEVTL